MTFVVTDPDALVGLAAVITALAGFIWSLRRRA